jgi:hypothetical protein
MGRLTLNMSKSNLGRARWAAFSAPVSRISKMDMKPDGTIKIRMPWKLRQRDRKTVIYPDNAAPSNNAPKIIDNTTLKALGRAFRWCRSLLDEETTEPAGSTNARKN